ncbi:MAG: alginate O-acetyltransferase complex protein AlgI [Saprospiraceae bacterium]|jgi:alginate O-acetyltransferase complex protein AlgI
MLFTWSYLLILVSSVIVYYLFFKKHQTTFLNALSLGLIAYWSLPSAIIVIILTLTTFFISKTNSKSSKYGGIVLHVIILFFLKTELLWVGSEAEISTWTFLGLSYFSLQNISVLLSNQKLSLNQLFLGNTFFSRFVAGPILTAKDFQLIKPKTTFNLDNIASGTQRILFGLGKKLILADRLSVITNNIFEPANQQNPGFSILFGSIVFTLQMYLDFSAYTDIAIGSAKLFGIDFKENFKLPFQSKTVTEYWRKTHISLIEWLTQHLYYPIVYSLRKHTLLGVTSGILITFIVSGLWHGNHIGYLIWGAINATYLLVEFWGRKKIKVTQKSKIGVVITFLLISFSNFFFLAKSWTNINHHLKSLCQNNFFPSHWMVDFVAIIGNGGHFLQQYNLLETAGLIILFFAFESKLERISRKTHFSFMYLTSIILAILFFGYFNAGDEFIYVQF